MREEKVWEGYERKRGMKEAVKWTRKERERGKER